MILESRGLTQGQRGRPFAVINLDGKDIGTTSVSRCPKYDSGDLDSANSRRLFRRQSHDMLLATGVPGAAIEYEGERRLPLELCSTPRT